MHLFPSMKRKKFIPRTALRTIPPRNIPEALRHLPRWVMWAWRLNKKGVWAKAPLRQDYWSPPNDLKGADSRDPEEWNPFAYIREYLEETFPGCGARPGFCLGNGCGLTGIDLDKCRDKITEVIEQWGSTSSPR